MTNPQYWSLYTESPPIKSRENLRVFYGLIVYKWRPMSNAIIVLDKSYLFQNVCRTVLSTPSHMDDTASYIEDVDVLMREQVYKHIVVGSNIYVEEDWRALTARNPAIKVINKVFVNEENLAPEGFSLLGRPFTPGELLSSLGLS